MGKFRKKPVVVEAVKVATIWAAVASEDLAGIPTWAVDALRVGELRLVSEVTDGRYIEVRTLESSTDGKMIADPGDWIIRGVKGELYPCKPDIFDQTYEAL